MRPTGQEEADQGMWRRRASASEDYAGVGALDAPGASSGTIHSMSDLLSSYYVPVPVLGSGTQQ